MYNCFAKCKELGAVAQVHAENGDLIAEASAEFHKGGVTLVNLQRQFAMIRCCAKNRSSITPRCGLFFVIFAVLQHVARF